MSVIVKDMQTPSECGYCPLCRYFSSVGATICMVTQATLAEDYKTIRFDGRHKECPLVELPEKHGRLVDADTLIAEWKDVLNTDDISPTFAMVLESAIRDVERAKVLIEEERKKGEWIPHEDEDGERYGDECSECGECYVMPYGKTNFCPNCGADMRGAQE